MSAHATTALVPQHGIAESTRNQSLDVLRGIAVALVLLGHFPLIHWLAPYGPSGVTLFFVLSGYLISGLLFAEIKNTGHLRVGRFLLRRGLKIWPALYVYLLFACAIVAYTPVPRPWHSLILSGAYLINYSPVMYGVVGHTWSLAIEEHFYLLLPFLLLAISRRLRWIPFIYCGLAVVCFIARHHDRTGMAYHMTHCRIDSLFVGVTLAYLKHFVPNAFQRTGVWPWGLILIVTGFHYGQQGEMTLAPIGFALILAWAVQQNAWSAWNPMAKLGFYSYGVYLWQQPLAIVAQSHRFTSLTLVILGSVSIAVGICMSLLIEQPLLKLRDSVVP